MASQVIPGKNCVYPNWGMLYASGVLPIELKLDADHHPWFAEQAIKHGLNPDEHILRRDERFRRYNECSVAISGELFDKILGVS